MNLIGKSEASRLSLLFAAVCFAFFIAHGVYSARVNSVTADEYVHLPVALSILETGNVELDHTGSPPLRALMALPVVAFKPVTDYTSPFWKNKEMYAFSWQFMVDNIKRYHDLYFPARLAVLEIGLLLALLVFRSAGLIYGAGASALAALFLCFNPEALAHSALATTDMIGACFFLPLFMRSSSSCADPAC